MMTMMMCWFFVILFIPFIHKFMLLCLRLWAMHSIQIANSSTTSCPLFMHSYSFQSFTHSHTFTQSLTHTYEYALVRSVISIFLSSSCSLFNSLHISHILTLHLPILQPQNCIMCGDNKVEFRPNASDIIVPYTISHWTQQNTFKHTQKTKLRIIIRNIKSTKKSAK